MSVLLEKLEKDGVVPLERYGHQVGGRQLFLKYRDCLCKPLIPRERFFYETAPRALRRYIPQYYGVVSVSYVKQPTGEIQVVASQKDREQQVSKHSSEKQFPKCTNGHSNGVSVTSTRIVNTDEYFTPWARMCSDNLDKGLQQMPGDLQDFNKDYVILENLTTKFEAPSVLDLKVGTNWPRENPSPQPTMASLKPTFGVRMAGMQKFNCLNNQYTFHDKYFGKQFTESEFSQMLRSFLDNGVCFRSDLLPTIVKMLKDLRASIRRHPSFRFFSSSLLVIYDGAECPRACRRRRACQKGLKVERQRKRKHSGKVESSGNKGRTDGAEESAASMECNGEADALSSAAKRVRSAFPNSSLSSPGNATPTSTPTHRSKPTHVTPAATLMLDTCTDATPTSDAVNRICSNESSLSLQSDHHLVNNPKDAVCISSRTSTDLASNGQAQHLEHFPETPPLSSETTPSLMPASELAEHRQHVDLRMIDFARSTHADHYDQVCYEGLDECYLTGLTSLIKIFQEMIDEDFSGRC